MRQYEPNLKNGQRFRYEDGTLLEITGVWLQGAKYECRPVAYDMRRVGGTKTKRYPRELVLKLIEENKLTESWERGY